MQRWGRGIQDDSSLGGGMEVLISLASYCPETQTDFKLAAAWIFVSYVVLVSSNNLV